ncbi:AAA family ATPase [Skermanella mucosa]|uniref:bifunctional aminoglycoside phosphotransferase/ATP-binding protein n=1 Tax=Skermanella mucosa TaxID=1789672 RepID=UPI00192BAA05|nr:bifunctional aminoglycoside phosphotransferase/ATP-binding protein [Skermanella mucosa]UEM19577.1 AAA family ATPase [Skermanella mucosa]
MTDHPDPSDQAGVVAFLSAPDTHGGAAVERVDTHGSIVFLAGDRVYKLKRAVRFPYMDYGTVERRRIACEAEVRLNRRTAPAVYLGAAPVLRRPDGSLALGGIGTPRSDAGGVPVDWVVVMSRLDQDTLFDRMADRGALDAGLMRDLAETIASFHGGAEVVTDRGGADAMRWVVEDNVAELAERPDVFPPDRVRTLGESSAAALDRFGGLLDRRRDGGFVRFCHGDLHLRNICLVDGRPTLFDCVEFNDDIAVIDVLYDLAFLLMDLEHRGLRPLANTLLNRMLELTGDCDGLALLPLFLSARAAVRAKVLASGAAAQPDPAAARAEAAAYLDHAVAAIRPPGPVMVALGGLSGTGKTTVARALAPRIGPAPGAVILRSDVLRKRLLGVEEVERLPPDAYSGEMTRRVYAELLERAGRIVRAGHAVVVDAVNARPEERADLEEMARSAGVPFRGVWLEADADTLIARVRLRTGDASDADEDVVRRQLLYKIEPLGWSRVPSVGDTASIISNIEKITL